MNPTTFSALAEPHRLQIVELLSDKPRPVNELVDRLHMNQPQVSKHLKVLADAGIVQSKPFAQQRFYVLQPEPFKQMDKWLVKFRDLWNQRFNRLDEVLKAGDNK